MASSETEAQSAELAELSTRARRADEYLALAQRTRADFENYRRRAQRDQASAQERGALKLASALLPALDNLERAISHAPAQGDGAVLAQGVSSALDAMLDTLAQAGIERYSPLGEEFDPNYHEAILQLAIEGVPAGTVAEVHQCGYRYGESCVRAARVVVGG